jgi:hypothetical protein
MTKKTKLKLTVSQILGTITLVFIVFAFLPMLAGEEGIRLFENLYSVISIAFCVPAGWAWLNRSDKDRVVSVILALNIAGLINTMFLALLISAHLTIG